MNITDIGHLTSDGDEGEDKMTKALKREGKPLTLQAMSEVAGFYQNAFVEDLKALNIELPSVMPRASENIAEDVEIVKILLQKDIAYKISDGIYYDISKYKEYGKLGKIKQAGLKEGARVSVNPEKRNPADFNLWKYNTELGFDTEIGRGFPGWHIECSAMAKKYLGQPFDIHTGGVDHIGTHHNNEIAQSEMAFNVSLAKYWMHNEHLNIDGGKMAKSGEGFLTLGSLEKLGISSLGYRCYLLGAHYRTPIVFPVKKIMEGEKLGGAIALERISERLALLPEGGQINSVYKNRFSNFINDDLNTSGGLAILWELLHDEKISPADVKATALKLDEVLGLNLKELIKQKSELIEIPISVSNFLKKRELARNAKNWQRADELRDEIKKLGFLVKDTEAGQKIEKI
jgi:cysteinyl-tRNA synthetase